MAGSEAASDLCFDTSLFAFLIQMQASYCSISQQHDLHDKNSEVCINTRSLAA